VRWSSVLWVALLALIAAAPAHADAMVFVKRNDVWISRPDGSRQIRLTTNGTRDSPYVSPSIADDGTIVALRRITLHSFRPTGRRIARPRRWAIVTQRLSTEPIDVDLSPNGRIVATDNLLYSVFYDLGSRGTARRSRPASSTSTTSARTGRSARRTRSTTTAAPRGSMRGGCSPRATGC
jgi:hypothetical protein